MDSRPGHGTNVMVWIPSSPSISFPNCNPGTELKLHNGLRWNFGGVAPHRRAGAAPNQRPHGGARSTARDGPMAAPAPAPIPTLLFWLDPCWPPLRR